MKRALLAFAAALALPSVLVASAGADEPVGKGVEGAFEAKGTDGYELKGLIAGTGEGDAGVLMLSVGRRDESATYLIHGTVTKEAVDFDLGALGEFDAVVKPTGEKETLGSECDGGKRETVEKSEYVGKFAFHGEEGFTEAEFTQAPLLLSPLSELVCGIAGQGRESGEGLPGAELMIKRRGGPSLELAQNHPGARVFYDAEMEEKEGAVSVHRSASGYLAGGAMTYSPTLMAARFSSRSPFSGSATYKGKTPPHQTRSGKGSWRGNLTVDFPGHAAVPLAGSSFKASIFPVHREKPVIYQPN